MVHGDGSIIPVFRGANVLHGTLRTLPGDRRIYRIDSWIQGIPNQGQADVLWVVPMDPEQVPVLGVAFNRNQTRVNAKWEWEFLEPVGASPPTIVLGPRPGTGRIDPRVSYRWSSENRSFTGPEGGVDEDFVRVRDPSAGHVNEFIMTGARRR